jgi:hypothetical protein
MWKRSRGLNPLRDRKRQLYDPHVQQPGFIKEQEKRLMHEADVRNTRHVQCLQKIFTAFDFFHI